ncbi:hypothetical protein R3P38DRAFT_2646905 [Favolaschia claudopus]|uniref:Uncharacterized protein n=1 Tax=Favolaschia claudopus TaxID=2862362 RepID=A0AAW0AC75_9AGAR
MLFLSLYVYPLLRFAAALDVHQHLVDLAAAGNGIIKLDSTSFDLLTSANPRRIWSASVVFTSLQGCNACIAFNASWTSVAQAWYKGAPKYHRDHHFFGLVDFIDSPDVIRKLNLETAPTVYNYLPTEGARRVRRGEAESWKHDISGRRVDLLGWEPKILAEQLSLNVTPIPIPYKEPFPWKRWFSIISPLFWLGTIAFYFRKPLTTILFAILRWTVPVSTVIVIIVMTSGLMYTRIREAPLVGLDGGWIARGRQNQFGREMQLVFTIYGVLAFSFFMLITVAPRQRSPLVQRLHIYFWTTCIVMVYSILVGFYKAKHPGYPFRLLL